MAPRLIARLDPVTRAWWRAVGRPVDLAGSEAWLAGPVSAGATVTDDWLEVESRRLGGRLVRDRSTAGLLAGLSVLDGPGFRSELLAPQVRDFYEQTSRWRMEAWSAWDGWAWPGGLLVSTLFGRRVDQLALPLRPLDVSHGIDSDVVLICTPEGDQLAAGWLRTLRATGQRVFSGCYSHCRLPGELQDSVKVVFPLEAGNVTVLLRPRVGAGGSLVLDSPGEAWGGHGAYVVVVDRDGRAHAARLPIRERFVVHVDGDAVLRTDHEMRLWSRRVLRLHYRLERDLTPR